MNTSRIKLLFIGLAAGFIVVLGIPIWASAYWYLFRPYVSSDSKADIPEIVLFKRIKMTNPKVVRWSSDSSRLIVLSGFGYHNQLSVLNLSGDILERSQVPIPWAFNLVIGPHQIVMMGDLQSDILFNVVDTAKQGIVFQQVKPDTGLPVWGHAQLAFALDPNWSILAVNDPNWKRNMVALYDTKRWRTISTFSVPVTGMMGDMIFSPNGKMIAVPAMIDKNTQGIMVIDINSHQVLKTIPVAASLGVWAVAFNQDGTKLAISLSKGEDTFGVSAGLEVVELSDATVIVRKPAIACPPLDPDNPNNILSVCAPTAITWDPLGRFILSAENDRALSVWNPSAQTSADGTIHLIPGFNSEAISPDGRWIAVSDVDYIDIFQIFH